MLNAKTRHCAVCGNSYWGVEGETCGPCEVIVRSWTAKGFADLCLYLEKVTKFEAFYEEWLFEEHDLEAHEESSDDPAPAEAPSKGVSRGDSPGRTQ